MLSWISLIPGLFNTVNNITSVIANERLKLIDAKTEKERMEINERITTLEAQRQLALAKSGQWETRALMAAFGIGPAFLLTKIYIWDKAIGQWTAGTTDKLDDNLWWVIIAQIGFYFLATVFKR